MPQGRLGFNLEIIHNEVIGDLNDLFLGIFFRSYLLAGSVTVFVLLKMEI
jgi:hypothetical protein